MDRIDTMLEEFFKPEAPPRLSERLLGSLKTRPESLEKLAGRFRIDASDEGVVRLQPGRGDHGASARARAHAERARQEFREYLGGRRTFFTVPVDLTRVADFQARVLAEANRIPFGEVDSYSALARRVGHPRAARAVGNALGANPVPVIVPCHRIVRGDGSWGHYAFGGAMKTQLLQLERTTPALIGCTSTRIICRRGCAHEQHIGEVNRVVFASVADAASVGYRPCRVCRPSPKG